MNFLARFNIVSYFTKASTVGRVVIPPASIATGCGDFPPKIATIL